MQINAREAALEALERCTHGGAWSGAAIDNTIKKAKLDIRDAALASRLCLGVLQNLNYCDFCIDQYYEKGSNKLEAKLLNILRLGVYQLLFMDKIPSRAAVNECVELCKKSGYGRASGLVNAVLRRVSERKEAFPEPKNKGSSEYLSVRYSHPLWLVEQIVNEHGYDFAESFFAKNNDVSALTIQVNTLKVSDEDYLRALARKDISFETVDGVEGCIRLNGGKVTDLPGFEEGLFYVQDLAARAAVEAVGLEPGMNVLDACSAPGGKSFAAAIAMNNCGSILSCDIHEKKLGLIRSGAERLGIEIIHTRARDARSVESELCNYFDAIIADVPCSGLGVIGKKPEIRGKNPEELECLPKIQTDILTALSKLLKPGGILLYSTCTVLSRENEEIVKAFLAGNPNFEAIDFKLGNIESRNGMYTFWPHIDGTDGFFAAKLKRIK